MAKKRKQAAKQDWWKSSLLRWLVFVSFTFLGSWLMVSQKTVLPQDPYPASTPQPNPVTPFQSVQIGSVTIQAEVRRTEAEQALGLSWRPSIGEKEGMVFVYTSAQPVMYWMKGMQFPLDFIWVRNGKVVEVTEQVPPPTSQDPVVRTVTPTQQVDTVIEVNAGFVDKYAIRVGDEVRIDK